MGLDRKVSIPADKVLAWAPLADFFAARQFPVKLLMIDGQLSFPDEQPPDDWRELRLGTPLGMVTLRREEGGVRTVTWGNADAALLEAWNKVTSGIAEVFGGTIVS